MVVQILIHKQVEGWEWRFRGCSSSKGKFFEADVQEEVRREISRFARDLIQIVGQGMVGPLEVKQLVQRILFLIN